MWLNNIKLLDILTTLLNDDYKNYQDQWHEFDYHTYFKFVDNQLLLTIPFYFNNSSEALTVSIDKKEDDSYLVSDLGNTYDYLEGEIDVVAVYDDLIDQICSRFNVKRSNHTLYIDLPPLVTNQTYKVLYRFLQCLSIVSNVDLFSLKKYNFQKQENKIDEINLLTKKDHLSIYEKYLSECDDKIVLPTTMVNPLFFKEIASDLDISLSDVFDVAHYKKFVEVFNNISSITKNYVKNGYEGAAAILELYKLVNKNPNSNYFIDVLSIPKSNLKLDEKVQSIRYFVNMYNEICPESIIRNNKAMIQKSLYNLFARFIKISL